MEKIREVSPPYLTVVGGILLQDGYRVYRVQCALCGTESIKHVSNARRGIGLGCACQKNVKYTDPRAWVLGKRYSAIQQRCRPGTYMAKNYGDRGIRTHFDSREQFIYWVLENLPHPTYIGVQLDRIDNEGDYEPGNLRLTTPSGNLANRRGTVYVQYTGMQVALSHVWHLIKTDHPEYPYSRGWTAKLVRSGLPIAEILGREHSGQGRPCLTSLTPDPAIVSLYRG